MPLPQRPLIKKDASVATAVVAAFMGAVLSRLPYQQLLAARSRASMLVQPHLRPSPPGSLQHG